MASLKILLMKPVLPSLIFWIRHVLTSLCFSCAKVNKFILQKKGSDPFAFAFRSLMFGDSMLKANDDFDLVSALQKIDIRVPGRTEGRTKEHTERYAVAHLLNTLLKSHRIQYPFSLAHRDRPDFLLSMGDHQIGIEHTEAVPQNEAHKMALREKGYGFSVYNVAHVALGEEKRTAKE